MQLKKSGRQHAKIKMALQGASGTGKTFSSLLLAKGLTQGNLSKVAIIDSENGSAHLYSNLGDYNVLSLEQPYSPENYIKAIEICEDAGMEVIIIDSISHCWDYLLDYHASLAGNSFTNWSKVTPRQKGFVDKLLSSSCHIIATMRTKQDYVLQQKDGKYVPEKVGLKAIQRDGVEYEFTLVLDLDIKNYAVASKDRTGLFMGKPEFKIAPTTGQRIARWCSPKTDEQVLEEIAQSINVQQLLEVYKANPSQQKSLQAQFTMKKSELEKVLNQKHKQNGASTRH